MTLEQQICSLDLAKRLKELGVKQESLFWWYLETDPATLWGEGYLQEHISRQNKEFLLSAVVSAFTVAELGTLLPKITHYSQDTDGWILQCKHPRIFGTRKKYATERADTEANVRAKVLIYLLENNLITL